MKRRQPDPPFTTPSLTAAELDSAFAADQDSILPSSGFADAVMSAVCQEAAAPAPIPFPWKRALPLLIAVAGALALAITACVAILHAHAASGVSLAVPFVRWHLSVEPLLRNTAGSDVFWVVLSLAIPVFCILVMRRFLFAR